MKKNYIKMSVVSLMFSALVVGCGSSDTTDSKLTKEGLWERKGYGMVLKIDQDKKVVKSYDFTRETCLESRIHLKEIQTFVDKAKLSTDKKSIKLNNSRVTRVQTLPQSCLDNRFITVATPTNTFEHLWHNFNDYYAFFDERKVDWNAQYSKYEPQVNEDMSQEELFQVMSNLLKPIDDGHVSLEADEMSFGPGKDSKFIVDIKEAFSQQTDIDNFDEFITKVISKYNSTLINYFDEESMQVLHESFVVATINSNIGYMKIDAMGDFTEGNEAHDDVKAVHKFMKKAMESFKDTDGIIIDVRINGGGYDEVSLAIASYFTDEKKKVFSKKAKYWDGETKESDNYINPSSPSYLKPVIVIGRHDTVSAGEIFLMSMKELSNVRLIGENSYGTFSDMLMKGLPNGWEMSLSNEVYYDLSHQQVEVVGIAPDINVSVFSMGTLEEGRDEALETALELLN